jgi:hypothetical protein
MNELLAHNPDFYLQYMLFDEVGLRDYEPIRWNHHPFNPDNHVNGLELPRTGSDAVTEFYDLSRSEMMDFQESYVQKVIDELDHHPNIIYEICNETTAPWDWQKHWVDFINARTSTLIANNPDPYDRPWRDVIDNYNDNLTEPGLDIVNFHTLQDGGDTNSSILSFHRTANRAGTPKVIKYDEQVFYDNPSDSKIRQVAWEAITAEGHLNWDAVTNYSAAETTSRHLASFISDNDIDPATMESRNDLVSRGYALANTGNEYVVFLHRGNDVTVNLSASSDTFQARWYDTATGNYSSRTAVSGGGNVTLNNPFGPDAVLHIGR